MISKISFAKIIRQHINTLYRNGTTKLSVGDLILFYGLPLIFAGVLVFVFDKRLSKSSIDFLTTVFSIFVGLLLNLLVLIFDHAKKADDKATHRRVLQETFANISYSILISVFLVVILILCKIVTGRCLAGLSFLTTFLAGNFFLTLLMILKRVHTLVWEETKS